MGRNFNPIFLGIGKNIKRERLKRGYTQAQLAFALGHNPFHISDMERGLINFDILELIKISDFFEVPLGNLFYEILEIPEPKPKRKSKKP